jgi:hypothetical protein
MATLNLSSHKQASYHIGGGGMYWMTACTAYDTWDEDNSQYQYRIATIDFPWSSIPQGSIINSAILNMRITSSGLNNTQFYRIQSPIDWQGSWGYVWGQPARYLTHDTALTTTYNISPFAVPTLNSFDVTNIVKRIISMGGGGICLGRWGSGPGSYSYAAVDTTEGNMPYLSVDYTPPNTAPTAPTVWLGTSSPSNLGYTYVNFQHNDPDGNNTQSYYQVVGSNNGFATYSTDTGKIAGSIVPHAIQVTIPFEGDWQFAVKTWDSYNVESPWGYSTILRVDRTAPPVPILKPSKTGWTTDAIVNVTIDRGIDNWSGLGDTYFRTTGAHNDDWTKLTGPDVRYSNVSVGNEGTTWLAIRSYDKTGNYVDNSTYVYIDRTPPTIVSTQGYSYSNQTTGTRRVWAYGVSDNLSGISHVAYGLARPGESLVPQGNAVISGSDAYADIPLTVQGEYTVSFTANDNAGNVGSTSLTKFFVDSVRANDPNSSVVYDETTATFSWSAFSDPNPSSGRATTDFYLGEWNGSAWVGTMLFNGSDIGNVTSKSITGLKEGTRYRYTVTYHDNAGNESAYTYREFVTKKKIGEYRIGKGSGMVSIPIYDPSSGVLGSKAVRTAIADGTVGCFETVELTDPLASPIRISMPQGIKALSK